MAQGQGSVAEGETVIPNGRALLDMLKHAVGESGDRNYYAEEPSCAQGWDLLVDLGLAVRGRDIPGGLRYYHVSAAGVAMLRAMFPRKYRRSLKGVLFSTAL